VVADMVGVGVFTSLGSGQGHPSGFSILLLWVIGIVGCGRVFYGELGEFPRSSEIQFLPRLSSGLRLCRWLKSATVGFSGVALRRDGFRRI
jgi:hypothetical protein